MQSPHIPRKVSEAAFRRKGIPLQIGNMGLGCLGIVSEESPLLVYKSPTPPEALRQREAAAGYLKLLL